MNEIFTNTRKYENNPHVLKPAVGHQVVHGRKPRRRLGHALGFFNGGNVLTFYLNLIFR